MKKRICKICGEEIKTSDLYIEFDLDFIDDMNYLCVPCLEKILKDARLNRGEEE